MGSNNLYNKQDALNFVDFLDRNLYSTRTESDYHVTDNMPDKTSWSFVAGHYDKFIHKILYNFFQYHFYLCAHKRLYDLKIEELPLYLNTTREELIEEIGSIFINENDLTHHLWLLKEMVRWRLKRGK